MELVGFQYSFVGEIMSEYIKIGLLCFIAGSIIMLSAVLLIREPDRLISCAELQEILNSGPADPNLVVDGVCGRKTQEAWDSAYNDQCAMETWPK